MGLPWWPWVPDQCANGHELAPGKVSLPWVFCDCEGATNGGHTVVCCRVIGCRAEAWPPEHIGPARDQR
jgi:hypothetical protein